MQKYYKVVFIIIIVIFCLRAVALNTKPGLFIGGDTGVRGVYPIQTLKDAVSTWCSNEGPGRDNTYSTTYIILSLFLALLEIIRFSQQVFTKIFFFLLLFIPGVSCFFLIRYLLSNGAYGFITDICSFVGSLFYMFNYFSRPLFGGPWGHLANVYAFMPLYLLLFIKGLDHSGDRIKMLYYSVLFGLVSVLIFSCNLAHTGSAFIILGLYFTFYILDTKKLAWITSHTILVCISSFLLSAFIILPFISSLSIEENLQRNIGLGWFSPSSWLYTRSYFLNLFRLDGTPDLAAGFRGFVYTPICIFFSYFLPIIVFSSLFWAKRNRNVAFFTLLAISGLFLAKGCQKPFGMVFFYIGRFIPPFTIFKFSYDKFSILVTLSYAVLVSFSLQQYWRLLHFKIKKWAISIILLFITPVFVCISWPFLTGGLESGGFFLKIPKGYYETVNFIKNRKGGFKILSLPAPDGSWNIYNWGYVGMDPLVTILDKPIVESYRLSSNIFRTLINDRAYWELCRLLRLYNIKYLLLHNDFTHFIPKFVRDIICIGNGIRFERDFGELSLYKVNSRFYRPHIYASNTPVLVVSNDTDAVYPIIYSGYLRNNPVLFFSRDVKKLKYIIKDNPNLDTIVYFNRDIDKWLGQIQRIKEDRPDLLKKTKSAYVIRREGGFNIEEDSYYRIKAIVSAKPYIERKREIVPLIGIKDLNNFEISPNNTTYDYSLESGILSIYAYFDGDTEEDEFVQIRFKEEVKADLIKYPYFYITYKVEDPHVQTIEVVMGIDLNGDGVADDVLKGLYPQPATEYFSDYKVNVYDLVQEKHPDDKNYNVVYLELYPHKIWWTDCSKKETKGRYGFWIKEAGFYGYHLAKSRQIITRAVDMMDKWVSNYNPARYELEEIEGVLTVSFKRPYMEISRDLDNIDIRKFSSLDFTYKVIEPDMIESIELVFGLGNREVFEGYLSVERGLNKYSIDIKEGIDRVIFRIRFNSGVGNSGDIFLLRRAMLSNKVFKPTDEYIFRRPVFRLDKDTYLFGRRFRIQEDAIKAIFKKRVFLKGGKHNIRNLMGDNLDFIIIEPEDGERPKPPEVLFNRISATRYEVKLTTDSPCWLVFSESFNPKWKAYLYKGERRLATIDQRLTWSALRQMWKDRGKRVEIKEHYMANGYANAWYVPKIQDTRHKIQNGTLNIVIEYIPQRFFELGCIVSGLSLLIICVILIWVRIERR